MSVLTISAVDNTTEQLTITAHGRNSGDGPAAIRSVGGALPAPLAALTDYWIIRVDANTIKLATSSANALAGTAINLTTNGSGTLLLEIGIPYRRARTYVPKATSVPGSELKSADLNAFQDALTALHDWFTGQSQSIWSPESPSFTGSLTVSKLFYTTHVEQALGFETSFDNTGNCTMGTHTRDYRKLTLAASATPIYTPIPGILVGDVITDISCDLVKNTTSSSTVTLDVVKVNASGETASGSAVSDNSNSPGLIGFGGTFNITVTSGFRYYVKITPSGSTTPSADVINWLAAKHKRPGP